MSKENLMKFYEQASVDSVLGQRLSELKEEHKKAIIALAKEIGFELTARDFEAEAEALTDDEIAKITGGGFQGMYGLKPLPGYKCMACGKWTYATGNQISQFLQIAPPACPACGGGTIRTYQS